MPFSPHQNSCPVNECQVGCGKVRRAKLYYLRGKKGKFAKVEDREFVASVKGKSGGVNKAQEPAGAASASKT